VPTDNKRDVSNAATTMFQIHIGSISLAAEEIGQEKDPTLSNDVAVVFNAFPRVHHQTRPAIPLRNFDAILE